MPRPVQIVPVSSSFPAPFNSSRPELMAGALVTSRRGGQRVQGRVLDIDPDGRNRTAVVEYSADTTVTLPIRSMQAINPVVVEESTSYQTDPEDDESDSDHILADSEESIGDDFVLINEVDWEIKISIPVDSRLRRQPYIVHSHLIRGGSPSRKPINYFDLMWPIQHFPEWIEATNLNLKAKVDGGSNEKHHRPLTIRELRRFIACLLYMTHYKLPRSEFWTKEKGSYVSFNIRQKTGISRNRFDALLSNLAFVRPIIGRESTPYDQLDALISQFHSSRAQVRIEMGSELCIDELFSSWVGVSSGHITKNKHKPKGIGQELICLSDVETGIMVGLELCKGAAHNQAISDGLKYGPAVTLRMAKAAKILGSGKRIVGDSRFASLATARMAKENGFEFTGCVKTATAGFPKKYLQMDIFETRGETHFLQTTDEILAIGWFDCSPAHPAAKRIKTFVSTCGTSHPGTPHLKQRSRIDNGKVSRYAFQVPRVKTVEDYYEGAGSVDRHNHLRQGVLGLEQVWGTHVWQNRVVATLFGVFFTDAYLAYSFENRDPPDFRTFNQLLFEELIEKPETPSDERSQAACWLDSVNSLPGTSRQMRCRSPECAKHPSGRAPKSSRYCHPCTEDPSKPVVLCDPRSGRSCFESHVKKKFRNN